MQHDEMIWQVINHQFCSYKSTLRNHGKQHFCKHPYSSTGLCNRSSCPLANAQYATIREEAGVISLYMKTVERAHSPRNLWERVTLSRNYEQALSQVSEHLQYFSSMHQHRCKQRLTKVFQYLQRMRRIELKQRKGKTLKRVRVQGKIEQRTKRRERKALIAAKLESQVEQELLQRLQHGTYGDLYQFGKEEEEEESELEEEEEEEVEYVEDLEESEDDQDMIPMEYQGDGRWEPADADAYETSSDEEEDGDDEDDNEDEIPKKQDPKKKKRRRVEIEYEQEAEEPKPMEAAEW